MSLLGLGVRKKINTMVNSTYQSSIHVECTVFALHLVIAETYIRAD